MLTSSWMGMQEPTKEKLELDELNTTNICSCKKTKEAYVAPMLLDSKRLGDKLIVRWQLSPELTLEHCVWLMQDLEQDNTEDTLKCDYFLEEEESETSHQVSDLESEDEETNFY